MFYFKKSQITKTSAAVLALSFATASLSLALTTQAQNLEIPVGQQGNAIQGIELPSLGMSKTYVEEVFGTPVSIRGPVGNPPITTWAYDGYTVYFEYNTVIHAVLKP